MSATSPVPCLAIAPQQRVVKTACDLLAQLCHAAITPLQQRQPLRSEATILRDLQRKVSTSFDESAHRVLLERLWSAAHAENPKPFRRLSSRWTNIGFQRNDPASDIRGGGELALESLVYMFERHPNLVARLWERRRERAAVKAYGNYPFACASINVTRALCEAFQILEPGTGAPTNNFEVTQRPYWHLVGSKEAFMELHCCAMALLDRIWDENDASYMDFNRILAIVRITLIDMISRLPSGVVPSAASFAPSDTASLHDIDLDSASSPVAILVDTDDESSDEESEDDEDLNDDRVDPNDDHFDNWSQSQQEFHSHAPLKNEEPLLEPLLDLSFQFDNAFPTNPRREDVEDDAVNMISCQAWTTTMTAHTNGPQMVPASGHHHVTAEPDFFASFGLQN